MSRSLIFGVFLLCACPAPEPVISPPDLASDLATPDLLSDLAPLCVDDTPSECLTERPADEHGLLNACAGADVTVILRDGRVKQELWRPGCELPPL